MAGLDAGIDHVIMNLGWSANPSVIAATFAVGTPDKYLSIFPRDVLSKNPAGDRG